LNNNNNRPSTGPRKPRSETAVRSPKAVRRLSDPDAIHDFVKPLRDLVESFGLHVKPTVHVNGPSSDAAIIVVDFGSPLVQVRLNSEQSGELAARLRRLTKEFYQGEVNVRIGVDNQNGIHWSALA
jgi:hypothetical protein